jgi:hypothetical protein
MMLGFQVNPDEETEEWVIERCPAKKMRRNYRQYVLTGLCFEWGIRGVHQALRSNRVASLVALRSRF